MADPQLVAALKDFTLKLTTSKTSERKRIFVQVKNCLVQSSQDIPENVIKGIFKLLYLCLHRYQDSGSQRAVQELIYVLSQKFTISTAKYGSNILVDFAHSMKNVIATTNTSEVCLQALTWSSIIMKHSLTNKGDGNASDNFSKMVETQSLLLQGVVMSNKSRLHKKAANKLKNIWLHVPGSAEKYIMCITKSEAAWSNLIMASFLAQYLSNCKNVELINKYKGSLMDQYIKVVLNTRSKPSVHLLENCRPFLRYLTHADFKDVLLPAVQKAMLRNPELILQAVGFLLSDVSIELSQYGQEIGKHLATHLHSKEDICREEACVATKNLAHQISDPNIVEELVEHFFTVLNGSEGKLTVTPQRISVLTGIGNLSYCTVSGSSSLQNLSSKVTENFIPFLKIEVHEGTLIHALGMLSLWCNKFTTEVPYKLIEWFKSGLALKTSTALVRTSYIQCMTTAFHDGTLPQCQEFIPLLLKIVEKASTQTNQIQLVSEAISASNLLLKVSQIDIDSEFKLNSFWNLILDADKQFFTSEKYLLTASSEALRELLLLVEKLLWYKKGSLFFRAVVLILTHPSSSLRKQAQPVVKRMLSGPDGVITAVSLIKEFIMFLKNFKVIERESSPETGLSAEEQNKSVSVNSLIECLIILTTLPHADNKDAEDVAKLALLAAHHSVIFSSNADLWLKILKKLKLDPYKFLEANTPDILDEFLHSENAIMSEDNALKTMTRIAPDIVMPAMISYAVEVFSNPELFLVTKEEHAIFLTPEGQLYDRSVIESAKQADVQPAANIKRESKAYSYKEQLAEIELRKEIEERKKKKGLKEEPQLNKKQIEAIEVQLEKESMIRKKLNQLHWEVERILMLLQAIMEGNPWTVRPYISNILHYGIPTLRSPLTAELFSKTLLIMMPCVFDKKQYYQGLQLSYVMLRLLKPNCIINPDWCQEDLRTSAVRMVQILYGKPQLSLDEGNSYKIKTFPASTFAYIFPLISCVLKEQGVAVGKSEKVMLQALEVIKAHAKLRISLQKNDFNAIFEEEQGPEFLPRRDILSLLCELIGSCQSKIQNLAITTFLEVTESANGKSDAVKPLPEEIDVLLEALQAHSMNVRQTALKGLLIMGNVLPDQNTPQGKQVMRWIWITKFDSEEELRPLAEKLWSSAKLTLESDICDLLLTDVMHHEAVIRQAVAEALAAAISERKHLVTEILKKLLANYNEKLVLPPLETDNFGRIVTEEPPDEWEARSGIASALGKLAPFLNQKQITPLFDFYVQTGLRDRSEDVRVTMREAAIIAVEEHGKGNVSKLLPIFEKFLDKAPNTSSNDAVRQSVIILMGCLARHLEKNDPKIKPILLKLINSLSTPSQQVQEAVANCLPPLVPAVRDDAGALVQRLLTSLLESDNYGERKGAAHGLAGVVKGLGILTLKQLGIMDTLSNAIQNKKNFRHREGALFAFEMMCHMLGRLFEPYIVHVLPHLLLCFGDNNHYVRQATDDTAKAVMSKLSGHGVKLVLPSLLKALEEDSWRTKAGSVELLGAMAFCAPKQLSSCLPSIVPNLIEVLSDSHIKVQKAGEQALKHIGSVIRNPEIQAIVPILLEALQDPSKKTSNCLQKLLETKFVHFIDAPSLALIMPVVQRAFQDRSTETRKMAAQIIGNMYSLTDQKDLQPYLPSIIPGLKQSLLDPVPEVRSVSARALGAMVKGMGESSFEDLLPWLMLTLTSETSSVDRSGAAQGLSEVVGGLGIAKLQKLMPDIVQTAERSDIAPHVKDGYIMMFIYLPGVFGESFAPYIGQIIPSILKALADESEYVRDTALRAGQRVVNMYAETAIELLLPELERGLFDENWRIRFSSVQLLGDLLYKISGVSGKMSTEGADDDDNFGTEHSQKAILEVFGSDRRNRVLSGLYMGRSDVALMVRQAALHVWKVVVTNTPRTLREILSTLFSLLLGCLASTSYDKRQAAARTLGDLVRKLGERVLPEIIPILEKGLDSDQPDQRQGVCIGLSEIMSSTSKDMVLTFVDSLVPTVQKALCDPLPEIRHAAAKTFDNLHATIGHRALDEILPSLVEKLGDPVVGDFVLDGLQQVMAIKSRAVLPYLVPQLTTPPINTKALSILSSVAGDALTKHLNKILPALLTALVKSAGGAKEQQELEYCQTVILSITDDVGVRTLMDELLEATRSDNLALRRAAVALLAAYCSRAKADYQQYVVQLLRGLIRLLTDTDERVLQLSWEALNAVTQTLDPAEQLQHVSNLRQAIRFATSDMKGQLLPGFCLPKGIAPILPIFREGLLNGSSELKEQAAIGLGEIIQLTNAEALKSSVLNITGPLIRILSDRFNASVKLAVLETLALLLVKGGVMLKPFLPQLQTTFLKALTDSNRPVRLKAATALSKLIVIHTRPDPLFTELITAVKNADELSVRETMLQALRGVVSNAGDKMGEIVRKSTTSLLLSMLGFSEDTSRMAVAGCLGALCRWLPDDELNLVLEQYLLDMDPTLDWILRHGRGIALSIALKEAPEKIMISNFAVKVAEVVLANTTTDRIPIILSGLQATGYLLQYNILTNASIPSLTQLITALAKSMNHSSNEVKQLAAKVCLYLAKCVDRPLGITFLKPLTPLLVNGTKEKNSVVKANSEFALVALLHLRKGDDVLQGCLNALDAGAAEALTDVVNKVLRKVTSQPDPKEDLDTTLIT